MGLHFIRLPQTGGINYSCSYSLLLRQCIRLISLFTAYVGQVSTCGHHPGRHAEKLASSLGEAEEERQTHCTPGNCRSVGTGNSLNAVQELEKED